MINQDVNYYKEFVKALDYAIEEHLPFDAHYSIVPGMVKKDKTTYDGFEVRIFTQGKRNLIEHKALISVFDTVDAQTRDNFINTLLNDFKKVILKKI